MQIYICRHRTGVLPQDLGESLCKSIPSTKQWFRQDMLKMPLKMIEPGTY